MILSNILNIFRHFIIQVCGTILLVFCSLSIPWLYFLPCFNPLEDVLIYICSRSSVPVVLLRNSFCSSGKSPQHTSKYYISSPLGAVRIRHIIGTHIIDLCWCWEWLLFEVLFGLKYFSLLLSIRMFLLHLGVYSFAKTICLG